MKKIFFLIAIFFCYVTSFAQILNPVKWTLSQKILDKQKIELTFKATLEEGWHVYGLHIDEGGPIATSFTFNKNANYELIGTVTETPKPITAFDKNFNMPINWHEKVAYFKQIISVKKPITVTGKYEFMVCNDKNCLPPTENEFSFNIKLPEEKIVENNTSKVLSATPNKSLDTNQIPQKEISTPKISAIKIVNEPTTADTNSLWAIFLSGFIYGFIALIMPCIFPMLPLTVSYFTKKGGSKTKAIQMASFYGISIVVVYVSLGMLVSIWFGSDALNEMASSGLFNIIFFILLVLFSISFFGAFEITLPSKWVNSVDKQADRKGYIGIFFMAFALSLVSFSCTGPLIGTLLVQAATSGNRLAPSIGMLGFSTALAIPFTLFAAFPSLLKSLPKSGGWLQTVKVSLGFLELALSLKFLSNVDLAYHFDLLDREVFLSLWIVIFALLGFYLLGKLKFAHDNDKSPLTLVRLFLSILVLSFTIYLIPGLWGAPLKSINAWLPPQTTQDFDLYTPTLAPENHLTKVKKKYDDKFKAPLNLDAYFDYDEALVYAKTVNKPLLIDFTGHSCVNCRKMEASVWSNPTVLSLLQNDFVLVSLYVDDKTELPENEQYISTLSGKKIKTIGNKWSDFQATTYQTNSQPYYVILNNQEKVLVSPQSFNLDVNNYINFLLNGKKAFYTK